MKSVIFFGTIFVISVWALIFAFQRGPERTQKALLIDKDTKSYVQIFKLPKQDYGKDSHKMWGNCFGSMTVIVGTDPKDSQQILVLVACTNEN